MVKKRTIRPDAGPTSGALGWVESSASKCRQFLVYKSFFAWLGLMLSPPMAHASSLSADSVHFCAFDAYEQWRRNPPRPAGKRLALNVGEPRTVRMIYFLPNDRPYRQEVVDSMKATMRRVQTFFADQMQAHGYGDSTFRIETDAQGEPMVHRMDGQHSDEYYGNVLEVQEVEEAFDTFANIYVIVSDNSSETFSGAGGQGHRNGKNGGWMGVSARFDFQLVAHELGHAFGLGHDFRDNSYTMSYGQRGRLSACAAEFLAVHPYFNTDISTREAQGPAIELISSTEYPAGSQSVSVQLKVSDPAGVHQVILSVSAPVSVEEVKECRGLAGQKESIVQFEYDGAIPSVVGSSLSNRFSHQFHVRAVDTEGNLHYAQFNLAETSPYRIDSLEGHTDVVSSVAFSSRDGTLASSSWDGTVKLWNTETRKEITTLSTGYAVSFSPDGKILAFVGGGVQLWNAVTKQRVARLTGESQPLSLAFSPDGATLAVGTWDSTVELWEVATKRQLATLKGHTYRVNAVSFSPDGTLLASRSYDGSLLVWNVATRNVIATLRGYWGHATSVAFSSKGTLAFGANERTIKLWDLATRNVIATLRGHTSDVMAVSFSPDGTLLASGAQDGTVKLWNVATREQIAAFGQGGNLSSLALSPDGTLLASGGADGTVTLWDVSEWTGTGVGPSDDEQQESRPHTLRKISGDKQQGPVGEQLAAPFVVSVLDANGSAFAGVVVTFSVIAGNGILSATTVTTGAQGRASARLTLGSQPGTNTVEATVEGLRTVTFTATAIEQTPHRLTKAAGDGQAGPASAQLAQPFVVSVVDQSGTPLAGVSVSFVVTAGEGMLLSVTSTNPCAIKPPTSSITATTDAQGRASARLTLGSQPGTNAVSATVEGLEPVTFSATAAEQAMPHRLTKVCGDSQEGTVGAPLTESFVVSASDEDGAAMAGVIVSFAVTAGEGTLSAATATTNAQGRASARLTLGAEPGTNTVAATVEGLEPVTFTATGQEDPLVSLFDLFGGGKRAALPDRTLLRQNAPNPFNPATTIKYALPYATEVELTVYNVVGQPVRTLVAAYQNAGRYAVEWDATDDRGHSVSSGMYFYRLQAGEFRQIEKMLLLR